MSADEYYENEETDYLFLDYDYLYEVIFDACVNDDIDALVALKDGTHECMRGYVFEEANVDLNVLEDADFCNPLLSIRHILVRSVVHRVLVDQPVFGLYFALVRLL